MAVNLTTEEWRVKLNPEQFRVLREKGTERAGTGMHSYAFILPLILSFPIAYTIHCYSKHHNIVYLSSSLITSCIYTPINTLSLTRFILSPPSPSPPLLTMCTGEYNKHKEKGVYNCAGCDAPLYKSDTKFDSGCGWPAFYAAIPGTFTILPSLHPLLLSCLLFSLLTMQVWGKFDAV